LVIEDNKLSKHVQCWLAKETAIMVAWIPANIAVVGNVVNLDDPEHGPTDGWTGKTAGRIALDSQWIRDRARDYLHQRRVSDL
jgi:hypothetical protein